MNQSTKLVYPVLRKAELTDPGNNLQKENAFRIANAIFENIESHSLRYIDVLHSIFSEAKIIIEGKYSGIKEEGNKAFIVDSPILKVVTDEFTYYVRSTTAVCYKNSSTKNWTRVSLEEGIPVDKEVLLKIKTNYNTIADACCKLNQEIFSEIAKKELSNNPAPFGDFTILTFGIDDKRLGKYLDLFDDIDLKLQELFSNEKEAERLIENYYKSLFNDYSFNTGEWLTSNVSFINKYNYVSDSNVLYKIERNNNSTIIEGIGHDESSEGIVAQVSSLKVARFIEEITNPESGLQNQP